MLIRVQVRLICPSQADANSVKSSLDQKLATKVLKTVHQSPTVIEVRGQWLVVGDVSFQLRADADDVYSDVQAKWTSGGLRNKILIQSTVTLHICTHAEGEANPADCRSIEYTLARKS